MCPNFYKNNDSIIFFNFREDRARQITKAFVVPEFKKIKKKNKSKNENKKFD
jgi:2,3-bisphosphoglycerate-independent phosphoglycerate mutase